MSPRTQGITLGLGGALPIVLAAATLQRSVPGGSVAAFLLALSAPLWKYALVAEVFAPVLALDLFAVMKTESFTRVDCGPSRRRNAPTARLRPGAGGAR